MTLQIKDRLFFDGDTHSVHRFILEKYFDTYPEKRPKMDGMLTSLWRGYIATFEITGDELFIKEITVPTADRNKKPSEEGFFGNKSVLDDTFPGSKKMDWYSGLIPLDDEDGTREIFRYIQVRQGNFVKSWNFSHEELQQFKQEQLAHFMLTDEYQRLLLLYQEDRTSEKRAREFLAMNLMRHLEDVK